MDPITLLLFLAGNAIKNVVSNYFLSSAASEAEESKTTLLGDLDEALATEKERLGKEYDVTKQRLEETRDTVLGSQRQGFFLRGDVGGEDTAAAQVIGTTENRAQSDLDLLAEKYRLGIESLENQTQLAKDELDWQFQQYMSGITAEKIKGFSDLLSTGISALGELDLPSLFATSPRGSATLLGSFEDSGRGLFSGGSEWNAITGYPGLMG